MARLSERGGPDEAWPAGERAVLALWLRWGTTALIFLGYFGKALV